MVLNSYYGPHMLIYMIDNIGAPNEKTDVVQDLRQAGAEAGQSIPSNSGTATILLHEAGHCWAP